jgi:hypothetical protein
MLAPSGYLEQLRLGTAEGPTIERGWTSVRLMVEAGELPERKSCPCCGGKGYFLVGRRRFVCVM